MMLAGGLFTIWWPVRLTPPNSGLTFLFYDCVLLAWIPFVLICGLMKPTGSQITAILFGLLLGLGLIFFLLWGCGLFMWQAMFPFTGVYTCSTTALARSSRVRYTCSRDYHDLEHRQQHSDPGPYYFEGINGFFLMWSVPQ